jgi:hypothetical protein
MQFCKIEMFMMVTMQNAIFWDDTPRGSVRTDILEERVAIIIRVDRINELGTTLAVRFSC